MKPAHMLAAAAILVIAAAAVGFGIGHKQGYTAGRADLANEVRAEMRETADRIGRRIRETQTASPATRPATRSTNRNFIRTE